MTAAPVNIHATAILLGDRGVIVQGPSGAGKSALAMAAVGRFGQQGGFARLVADDQLFLRASGGRLIAEAPPAIAGFLEIRGLGVTATAHEPRAVIDLFVRLVDPQSAPRMAGQEHENILGIAVPLILLPCRNTQAALPALIARLYPNHPRPG